VGFLVGKNEETREYKIDADKIFDAILETLPEIGFKPKIASKSYGQIEAKNKIDFITGRQKLEIDVSEANGKTSVYVKETTRGFMEILVTNNVYPFFQTLEKKLNVTGS